MLNAVEIVAQGIGQGQVIMDLDIVGLAVLQEILPHPARLTLHV
jgi:hypothetical protein